MTSLLFQNIDAKDIPAMTKCLGGTTRTYQKGEVILHEGDEANLMGLVKKGKVNVVRTSYEGRRSIVGQIGEGGTFAEAYAMAKRKTLPVTVEAAEDKTEVLLMEMTKILTTCSSGCSFHNQIVKNLVSMLAEKTLLLQQKIEITSNKTTREKLIAYLKMEAKRQETTTFTIPLDRQQLADYLGVDRSAMSSEIGKLRDEGFLEVQRSTFHLL